jgi:hypothetical protein
MALPKRLGKIVVENGYSLAIAIIIIIIIIIIITLMLAAAWHQKIMSVAWKAIKLQNVHVKGLGAGL